MMTARVPFIILPILAFLAGSLPAAAQESPYDQHEVYIAGGVWDVTGNGKAAEVDLAYRGPEIGWKLRPQVGAMVNGQSAFYLYGGLVMSFELGAGFETDISTAAGYYNHENGPDPGGPLEFRSGVDVGYRFESGTRVGIAFRHLSNAGIYGKNPGAESLLATLSQNF